MYPIDLWPAVEYSALTSASDEYLSSLEPNTHHEKKWFEPSSLSKVEVTRSNVSRLQLFGDDQPDCTLLALHPPAEPTQVVALYLHGKWWSVSDVLRTSRKSRTGLVEVQSAMERVVLFLLSQVVEKPSEKETTLFSPHPRKEHGKLLWCDGEAVGFYTVKQKGSLCDSCTSQSYLLPVLDTVLVRMCRRRRGLGLQMLEDFCSSFPREEVLGVSHPLSPSMVAVCRKYLQQHEAQRERLYEVEAPGGWTQRRNIWLNIQLGRYTHSSEERSHPTLREMTRTVEEDGSHKQPCNSRLATTASENPCDLSNQRPQLNSSDPAIKTCDTNQAGGPLTDKSSRARCSSPAHSKSPDLGPLPRMQDSVSSRTEPRLSDTTDQIRPRRRAEETLRSANSKRVRKSLD